MTFTPIIPMGGYTGWRFLERTLERQEALFSRSPSNQRLEAYFRQSAPEVKNAADLVSDHRLLKVTLTAFGLAADLPNKAFIRKVLESDTSDPKSFAGRLVDKRYLEMAKAFGFGNGLEPSERIPQIAEAIITRFQEYSFEEAVGNIDVNMRHALSLQRELRILAERNVSEDTKWYTILGTPALREVFQTAFNLPAEFSSQDIDRQLSTLQGRTFNLMGDDSIGQFQNPAAIDRLVRIFLISSQLKNVPDMMPSSAALSILMSIRTG